MEGLALLLEGGTLDFDLTVELRVLVVRSGEVGGEGVEALADRGKLALRTADWSASFGRSKGEGRQRTSFSAMDASVEVLYSS